MAERRTLDTAKTQRLVVLDYDGGDHNHGKYLNMKDLTAILSTLKRPAMLVGAARKGLTLYRRDRDLPRLIAGGPSGAAPGSMLLETEAELERTRAAGDGSYSVTSHIAVLTALLFEARLGGPAQPIPSGSSALRRAT